MPLSNFIELCNIAPLNVCPLIKDEYGVFASCSSRGIKLGSAYLFEIATMIVYLITIGMIVIILFSIKHKVGASGKKGMVLFFYLYMIYTLLEMITLTNLVPMKSFSYIFFVSCHFSLGVTMAWSLLLFSISNYYQYFPKLLKYSKKNLEQDEHDSVELMIWCSRVLTLGFFFSCLIIGITTFNNQAGLNKANPYLIYTFEFIVTPIILALFLILRVVYLWFHTDSYWPIGDLLISTLSFALSQMCLFLFSNIMCVNSKHYLDGSFFSSLLMLLAIMMLYKSWDSANKQDLEFVIGDNPFLNNNHRMDSIEEDNLLGNVHV